jgi:RND superfamily putative drug exporter
MASLTRMKEPYEGATTSAAWIGRLTTWCLDHAGVVVAVWILLAAAGLGTLSLTSSRLSATFDLPGQPAFVANQHIARQFHSGGDTEPLVAVVTVPSGHRVTDAEAGLRSLNRSIASATPVERIVSYASSHDGALVSTDRRTTFVLIYPRLAPGPNPYDRALPALQLALRHAMIDGAPVRLTGQTILATGGSNGGGNSILVETLLAAAAAMVVLAVIFGSLLALLPLLIALLAIPTTLLGVLGFTAVTTMSTLDENIVALIGLGIGIDYALLIVTRWREERSEGRDGRAALLRAASTAGESVLFSGTTVAISLAALVLTPVPFLRSFGIAGALIALTSVAVALTLLPVVLDRAGPRLEWPRRRPAQVRSPFWERTARLVVRRRWAAAGLALGAVLLLASPVLRIHLGEPSAGSVATTAPQQARLGVDALQSSGIGTGVLRPAEILAPPSVDVTTLVRHLPGAHVAVASTPRGGKEVVDVWSTTDASTDAAKLLRSRVRTLFRDRPGVQIGGAASQDDDEISTLYGTQALVVIAAVVIATFLLPDRALRSVWLPVKALALNVISLAASYGVLTFIWQEGHGSSELFGSPATGSVTIWVPLAIFALLFGLSMDYEVFILTRIREEYGRSGDTRTAVVEGISRTGRLVTSGALILFFSFVALGGVPVTDVKVLSTGLAAGIIVDATLIRGVLAPALVALLDQANWWFPRPLARALGVPRTPPPP